MSTAPCNGRDAVRRLVNATRLLHDLGAQAIEQLDALSVTLGRYDGGRWGDLPPDHGQGI